jgi:hypothetical protein
MGEGRINGLRPLSAATRYQPIISETMRAAGGMISLRQFMG